MTHEHETLRTQGKRCTSLVVGMSLQQLMRLVKLTANGSVVIASMLGKIREALRMRCTDTLGGMKKAPSTSTIIDII